jgi:POT family proton-dependent oligopeptide transporter
MWERFSFYGLRALLVVYMVKVLLMSDHRAYGIFSEICSKLLGLVMVLFGTLAFMSFTELAASALTLFAARNVNLHIGTWVMPAPMTQSFNPFFIIVLSPLLAKLWSWMGAKNISMSTGIKLARNFYCEWFLFEV